MLTHALQAYVELIERHTVMTLRPDPKAPGGVRIEFHLDLGD